MLALELGELGARGSRMRGWTDAGQQVQIGALRYVSAQLLGALWFVHRAGLLYRDVCVVHRGSGQGCSTGIFRRHPVAVTRGVVGGRSPRMGSLVSRSQRRRFSKAAEVR